MSDWNADILDPNSSDFRIVSDPMSELSLKLIDIGPSHLRATVNTWIDFFSADDCDSIKDYNRTFDITK